MRDRKEGTPEGTEGMQASGGVEGGDTVIRIDKVRKRTILSKWGEGPHNQPNKNKPKHLSLHYINTERLLPSLCPLYLIMYSSTPCATAHQFENNDCFFVLCLQCRNPYSCLA